MTNFLFWNLNHNIDLTEKIRNIANSQRIDIIILCECEISPSTMLKTLNHQNKIKYFYIDRCNSQKFKIFANFNTSFFPPISESYRYSIRHLTIPGFESIIIAIIHFIDKRNFDDDSQNVEIIPFTEEIKRVEEQLNHSRTIIVGDLNMDPYQAGMVNAFGINGVMSKEIAYRRERIVQRKSYKFFYNPMWNLYGDETKGPPGTYYFNNAKQKAYFWHMLDQVLIRPELIKYFDFGELEILTNDGAKSLTTTAGIPDRKNASDHLPIKFSIELKLCGG